MAEVKFDTGAATRPCRGFAANGDRYYVQETDWGLLVAVIDGLGHGAPAEEAAVEALKCLTLGMAGSTAAALRQCDEALLHSRGVVAGVAVIDLEDETIRYTGIGNIEAQLYTGGNVRTLISSYGIIGSGRLPSIREHMAPFPDGALLIMFSDGISGRFRLADYSGLMDQPAQFIADVVLRDWGRANDDATVVVVRREGRHGES